MAKEKFVNGSSARPSHGATFSEGDMTFFEDCFTGVKEYGNADTVDLVCKYQRFRSELLGQRREPVTRVAFDATYAPEALYTDNDFCLYRLADCDLRMLDCVQSANEASADKAYFNSGLPRP